MAPEAPPKPVDFGYSPKRHANPGRRAARDAARKREKWIAFYSPHLKAFAWSELQKEKAKPKEDQDKERTVKLKDAACFTPFKRTEPKVRHQRGAIKRLIRQLRKNEGMDQTAILPNGTKVEYIAPDPMSDAITGPK